ncbi:hypothetical protein IJ135_01130 [Candidatus Saccharibacteria bacterium]|nr:hypothetical protein [Candidatus Saccharibacteria bacterium]
MPKVIHTIKNQFNKTKYNISQTRSRLSPSLRVRRSSTSGRCPADGLRNITFGLSKTRFYILYMVGFVLSILLSGTFIPFYIDETKTEATVGIATQSTISLSLSSNNITLNLLQPGTYDANNLESGIFGSASTTASISTTNYTGYTLSIAATNNNGSGNANNYSKLIDSSNTDTSKNYFASIESAVSEVDFSANTTTASNNYNGKWGYKPSYYNSSANSNYLPAPSTTGTTINSTVCPNSTSGSTGNPTANCTNATDTYTFTLGARANINQSAGSYSNTFNIVATANPVTYSITYSDNSGDSTVSNLPSVQASSLNAQSKLNTSTISLSSTIPTRTGYTFNKWCLGTVSNSGTTCSADSSDPANRPGTLYSSGADFGIDQTTDNSNITLYATWTINQYTCTKRYRLQNADGSFPTSYTSDGTEQVNYKATCTYAKTITDYKSSASATNSTEVSTSGTMTTSGITLSLDFYRDTYALTINRNTTYISSVSGAGTYRWGQSVSISASPATNSKFTTWSQTSGTTSSFASSTTASTTFTMPKSAATIYANGETSKSYIQDFTKSMCQTQASSGNVTVYDKRDENSYTVRYINGNCWMTQNLSFGSSNVSSTNTNVASSTTMTFYSFATQGTTYCQYQGDYSGYSKACRTASSAYGAWYNFAAASAYTIIGTQTTAANSYDICPSGWHLPDTSTAQSITGYATEFQPVVGGRYHENTLNYTSTGYWWLSTSGNVWDRYYLSWNGSSFSVYTLNRVSGLYIRCVRTN